MTSSSSDEQIGALGLLLTAMPLCSQDPNAVFRATAELVTVDVQVRHIKHRVAAHLAPQASDFQVSEEGDPQTILYFSRDEYPLSVVLLFDLTDSVRGVLRRLAEAAESTLEHFARADEVAVMVYSGHASQATIELSKISKATSRRVVIWLTDNLPNIPYPPKHPVHTEMEALRALNEEGVTVAPILLRSPVWEALGPIVRAAEGLMRNRFRRAMRGSTRK